MTESRPRKSFLAAGCVVLFIAIPACSSSPSEPTAIATTSTSASTTSTTSALSFPQQSSAEVAACIADAKTLEMALDAYQVEKGSFPSPPAPWSASTYAANYQPLTDASGGGPFLPSAPGTRFYVIEYDSAGQIWIAPPGAYGTTFNPGEDFAAHPDVCLPAAR
jgi:hypothetical protein